VQDVVGFKQEYCGPGGIQLCRHVLQRQIERLYGVYAIGSRNPDFALRPLDLILTAPIAAWIRYRYTPTDRNRVDLSVATGVVGSLAND